MSTGGNKKKVFHFTLGPVQDFIADARRLRDYWAGSFILSLLSGHAMKVVEEKEKGAVVFPRLYADSSKGIKADDELFAAIMANNGAHNVYIGSLPNRFKANADKLPDDIGEKCKCAIENAWQKICNTIWNEYVKEPAAEFHAQNGKKEYDNPTQKIWERQTKNFWDMAWAIGKDDGNNGAWLDMRKNWRSLKPELNEGGDHCRLMGQYQELSGVERFSNGQSKEPEEFWKAIREQKGIGRLDLPDGEYLCALALIKRLFPVHLERSEGAGIPGVIPWKPGGNKLNIRHWPSTSYIAAVPWLKNVESRIEEECLSKVYKTVKDRFNEGFMGEQESSTLFDLSDNGFFKLDGHLYHEAGIISFVKEAFSKDQKTKAENAKKAMLDELVKIAEKIDPAKKKKVFASGFYAILRMDGDSIGAKLGRHEEIVKNGLALFTQKVKAYFAPDNAAMGVLVYAGGDDVLAVLPVDSAIQAARDLRDEYAKAFEKACNGNGVSADNFTLSGSIIYSHFKNPLSQVLRLSEHQLDKIAKNKNGRNSLAIAIAKPGGISAEWVSVFGKKAKAESDAALQIVDAAKNGLTHKDDALLSGGFFHKFRDHYEAVFAAEAQSETKRCIDPDADSDEAEPEENPLLANDDLLKALIKSDLQRQFRGNAFSKVPVDTAADAVIRILRTKKGDGISNLGIAFGGGMIVRFLAQESRPEPTAKSASASDENAEADA